MKLEYESGNDVTNMDEDAISLLQQLGTLEENKLC